ncbi:MAG: hypothetical protein FJX76_28605 [Armatimonadetes bacterium]|nr:hypothetical protein [Armatimonadota bacterium]
MPSLDFRWQLPYRYDDYGRFGPFVDVGLVMNENRHDFLCLLDTGAERTLLDGQHLRAVGLDLYEGRPRRVSGFLAYSVVVYEHRVGLAICGLELDMPVLFSTQPLDRAVIGRDVMAEFRFGLRERAGEIFLSAER